MTQQKTIAIIGLGYVGLPLAVEFGKHRAALGLTSTKPASTSCSLAKTTPSNAAPKNCTARSDPN